MTTAGIKLEKIENFHNRNSLDLKQQPKWFHYVSRRKLEDQHRAKEILKLKVLTLRRKVYY